MVETFACIGLASGTDFPMSTATISSSEAQVFSGLHIFIYVEL